VKTIVTTGLVFNLPLYARDGASFISPDACGHVCTVTGAEWRYSGRWFNKFNHKIGLPDDPRLTPTTGLTLEAWIKPELVINTGRIISRLPDGSYKGWSMFHYTYVGFQCHIGGSLATLYGAADSIAANVWHHAACTYDGSAMRIYIEGEQSGNTLERSGSIAYDSLAPAIGMDNGAGINQPYGGIIAEARIYNRGLTRLEVERNYLATRWRYV